MHLIDYAYVIDYILFLKLNTFFILYLRYA